MGNIPIDWKSMNFKSPFDDKVKNKFYSLFKMPVWLENLLYGKSDSEFYYRTNQNGKWKRPYRWTNLNKIDAGYMQFKMVYKNNETTLIKQKIEER